MKKISLLIAILSLLGINLKAQQADLIHTPNNLLKPYTINQLISTGTATEALIEITDVQLGNTGTTPNPDLYYHVQLRFFIEENDAATPTLLQGITLNPNLEIIGKDNLDVPINSGNIPLQLSIDPNQDKALAIYRYNKNEGPDFFKSISEIKATFSKAELETIDVSLRDKIKVELAIDFGRYELSALPLINTSFATQELKENEVMVVWDDIIQKPSYYELEWVFMNEPLLEELGQSNGTYLQRYVVDFSKNVRRVQTRNNYYPINIVKPDKYLVTRVRAVRQLKNENGTALLNKIEYGPWSISNSATSIDIITVDPLNPPPSPLPSEYNYNVFPLPLAASASTDFNWQQQIIYSSEGKKKENIQFFDGSNRLRQNVSVINDFSQEMSVTDLNDIVRSVYHNSTTIAQESYYDYNGNPSIEVLPTPLVNAGRTLGYQENINRLNGNKLLPSDYDDLHNVDRFKQPLDVSSTEAGAARYYSPQNLLHQPPTGTPDPLAAFIPDAKGYVYNSTEYLADGSGRIKAQYASGEKLGSDPKGEKNNRFFYVQPLQSELDVLFGTNIGEANFYKKNITVDGNGVLSYAYIDQKDRTVATSIAGSATAESMMLDAYEPEDKQLVTFNEELLAKNTIFIEEENRFSMEQSFFSAEGSTYKFTYNLNKQDLVACVPALGSSSSPLCFSCPYTFDFKIIDEEGQLVVSAGLDWPTLIAGACNDNDGIQFKESSLITGANYSTATLLNGVLEVPLLAQHKYSIVQNLSFITDQLQANTDEYISNEVCDRYDYEHFLNIELDNANFEECETEFEAPCASIREQLQDDFRYPAGAFVKHAEENTEMLEYILMRTRREVDGASQLQESVNVPLDVSHLHTLDKTRKEREYRNEVKERFLNTFPDLQGQQPTFADFENRFLDFFIEIHPSYCKLSTCEALNTDESKAFDKLLDESTTITDFQDKLKASSTDYANLSMSFNGTSKTLDVSGYSFKYWDNNDNHYLKFFDHFEHIIGSSFNEDLTIVDDPDPNDDPILSPGFVDNPAYIGNDVTFTNDLTLLQFDPFMIAFTNNSDHRLWVRDGFSWVDYYVGIYQRNSFPSSKQCYFDYDPSGDPNGESEYNASNDRLHLMFSYFNDTYGCNNNPPNNLDEGVTDLIFYLIDKNEISTEEEKWELYKGIYAQRKVQFINDMINNSSCQPQIESETTLANPCDPNDPVVEDQRLWFYETDLTAGSAYSFVCNKRYWKRKYNWGDWWKEANPNACDIYLGNDPATEDLSGDSRGDIINVSDPQTFVLDKRKQSFVAANNLVGDLVNQIKLDLGEACLDDFDTTTFKTNLTTLAANESLDDFTNDPYAYTNGTSATATYNYFAVGSTCDAYDINWGAVLSPYFHHFEKEDGSSYFQQTRDIDLRVNCHNLLDKIDHFDLTLGQSIPSLPNGRKDLEVDNQTTKGREQKRLSFWLNFEYGFNLSFQDYYEMVMNCELAATTSIFGNSTTHDHLPETNNLSESTIRNAVIAYGNKSTTAHWPELNHTDRFFNLNLELNPTNDPNALVTVDETKDYLSMGELNMADDHHYLFYIKDGQTTYNALLTELNEVFNAIKAEINADMLANGDYEDRYWAKAVNYPNLRNTAIPNTSLTIDRVVRHARGSIWVRLLDNTTGEFYDDFYYHYQPHYSLQHEKLKYRLSELTASTTTNFTNIYPVFHGDDLHYAKIQNDDHKILVSTAKTIATAFRVAKTELNARSGRGQFPIPEDCEDLKYERAKLTAAVKYDEYIEALKEEFKRNYVNYCTNRMENNLAFDQSLNMEYQNGEHHFTLYYYDQADNLVATVPPHGVDQDFRTTYTETIKNNIATYRNNNSASSPILPAHSKQTSYQYNADNQIIKQTTPNGGTTYFWYDKAGRLVLSQNEKQRPTHTFSYTLYDGQSRIVESGVTDIVELGTLGSDNDDNWEKIHGTVITELTPDPVRAFVLKEEVRANERRDVVKTYYDRAVLTSGNYEFTQDNLRSRVGTQAYFKSMPANAVNIDGADLALHLDFNANINDHSGNMHHGSLTGELILDQDRKEVIGKAYGFNGSNKVTIADNDALDLSALSVAAWVKANSSTSPERVIVGKYENNQGWLMSLNVTEELKIEITSGGQTKKYESSTSIQPNVWSHLAFTFENNNLELYINGLAVGIKAQGNIDQMVNSIVANSAPINIAHINNSGNDEKFLSGAIDDIRIYKQALNATQIQTLYNEIPSSDDLEWHYATHYSYDAVGNVKSMLNDFYQAARIDNENSRFKRLDYAFDPVSGNVLNVYYQLGKEDAFYHRYEYDAENRITKVESSMDGIIWDEDANYQYYLHGPLARTELGEHKVQGMDYAYTLQGWLKSVNSGVAGQDMQNDHFKNPTDGPGAGFGEDAFGFALQYFEGDYTPIGGNTDYLLDHPNYLANLYNGNIAAKSIHNQETTFGKVYNYDQLNRLRGVGENNIDESNKQWQNSLLATSNTAFYEYDGNGNLEKLQRIDGESGLMMDDFTYEYIDGKDLLRHVNDAAATDAFPNDIDQQFADNYSYDEIGNLTADQAEDILKIEWHPNGKIKSVLRNKPVLERPDLRFEYDALGNRVKKTVSFAANKLYYVRTTYYSRDAQGNIMATYEERDCDYLQADDNTGLYHYQYGEGYQHYIDQAIAQTSFVTIMDFLNGEGNFTSGGFAHTAELVDEAALLLDQVSGIRSTIISNLSANNYLTLYPSSKASVLTNDPFTYGDYLFNHVNYNQPFTNLMNDKNEAWIHYHKAHGNASNLYNKIDSLYNVLYSNDANVISYYLMNKDAVEEQFNNQTFLTTLLGISASDYTSIYGLTQGSPSQLIYPTAVNTMQTWMNDLLNQLVAQNPGPTTAELIHKINAALLMIDYTAGDATTIFQSITPSISHFYGANAWLPANLADRLNTILYHFYFINSSLVNTGSLIAFKPSAVMDWSMDTNGDLLKYFIHADEAEPAVLATVIPYLTPLDINNWNIYFDNSNTPNTAYQFVSDAMQRNYTNSMLGTALTDNGAHTVSILDQTESLAQLINYFKQYHPRLTIEEAQNNNPNSLLGTAMNGIDDLTVPEFVEALEALQASDLSPYSVINFPPLGNCNPHEVSLMAERFDIYGSSRLGTMDAKQKRKEEGTDNSYRRKLGSKTYELSDHLGNVVATISDKKLHPQETVNVGDQNIDPNIGFQPQLTGQYDYYPFGMEIMSRSGDFTTADYTQDTYEVLYQGLLDACPEIIFGTTFSYPGGVYTTETAKVVCDDSQQNLYGQSYVSSFQIGVDDGSGDFKNINAATNFTFEIPILDKIVDIDPDALYSIEIYFDKMKNRGNNRLTVQGNGEVFDFISTHALPSSVPNYMNVADEEKKVIVTYTGQQWIDLAAQDDYSVPNSSIQMNNDNAVVVSIQNYLAYPWSTTEYHPITEFKEIRISKVTLGANTPIAMRDGEVYPYGFQGQEREGGAVGIAAALFSDGFEGSPNSQLVGAYPQAYPEDFSTADGTVGPGATLEQFNGENRLVIEPTTAGGSVCYTSNSIPVNQGERLIYTVEVERVHSSAIIEIILEYWDATNSSWEIQEVINPIMGRKTYTLDVSPNSSSLRLKISAAPQGGAILGYVYNINLEKELLSGWTADIRADGQPAAYIDNGRLKLQADERETGAISDEIAIHHKGEEHTLHFDLERISGAPPTGTHRVMVRVMERHPSESVWRYIPWPQGSEVYVNYFSDAPENNQITMKFTPTRALLRIYFQLMGNVQSGNPPVEAYIDNISISDGEHNTTASISNQYAFKYRIHDARLPQWLSLDPKRKAYESPYVAFSNNPIWFTDSDGRDTLIVHRSGPVKEMSKGNAQIFVLTYSLIQKGVESTLPGRMYMMGNKEYIKLPENTTLELEFQKMKKHNYFTNTIRVKHPNAEKEIFLHQASFASQLHGCYSCSEQEPIFGDFRFGGHQDEVMLTKTEDALETIRNIYDINQSTNSTKGSFGFQVKTNSSAPNMNLIQRKGFVLNNINVTNGNPRSVQKAQYKETYQKPKTRFKLFQN